MRDPSSNSSSPTGDDVSPDVWCDWILEAIRKIRAQKQRPSIQRICQAIGSHHKYHEDIVARKLEAAVTAGRVIKVYNKGLHSYKAPVARRRVEVAATTNLSRLVAKAVRELGECAGSSLRAIETYVQRSNSIELSDDRTDFRAVVKNSVRLAVEQELLVQEGKLYKVGRIAGPLRKSAGGTGDSPQRRSRNNAHAATAATAAASTAAATKSTAEAAASTAASAALNSSSDSTGSVTCIGGTVVDVDTPVNVSRNGWWGALCCSESLENDEIWLTLFAGCEKCKTIIAIRDRKHFNCGRSVVQVVENRSRERTGPLKSCV